MKRPMQAHLLLLLLLLASAMAIRAQADAKSDAAVSVVKQLMDRRAEGNIKGMLALLTQSSVSAIDIPTDKKRDQMLQQFDAPTQGYTPTPELKGFLALLVDTGNTLGYTFTLVGPAPDDPQVVQVSTVRASHPTPAPIVIKIVTATDPGSGACRIDALQTFYKADPELAKHHDQAVLYQAENNMQAIAICILQYAQAHGQKLPDADKWIDEIMPLAKQEALFMDPSPDGGSPSWNYAYNRNLSGALLSHLSDPANTVLVFESTAGTKNAADTGASLPHPGKHQGGTPVAFADAHVDIVPDNGPPLNFRLAAPVGGPGN